MKKILLVAVAVLLILGTNAGAFFLNFEPVTQLSDNTAIAPTIGIFYDVEVDGAPMARMFPTGPTVKIPLTDNTFGATHTYRMRTHLSDGRISVDYVATLISPLDDRSPKPPGAPLSITK